MNWTRSAMANVLGSVLLLASIAAAQSIPTTDVLGVHGMNSGSSSAHDSSGNACLQCHSPHNGLMTPRWSQSLSTSTTPANTPEGVATRVGAASLRCLSCHDGTIGKGRSVPIGILQEANAPQANVGAQLEGSHPFSLQPQLKDNATLVPSLVSAHTTKDPIIKLVNDNIECPTCHDVHNQYKDPRTAKFLVLDNTGGRLCLACHEVNPRTLGGINNSLTGWPNSAHALSSTAVAPKAQLGGYTTVKEFACANCHRSHNALGAALLRKNPDRPANIDETSQACFTCHDGSDKLAQPLLNVADAFNGGQGHPFPDANNQHKVGEPAVLDRNRHASCADCHNSHAAQPTTFFSATPDIRPSQFGVAGVTSDGVLVPNAAYQYETCLRCHGTSQNKQSLPGYGYMPARALFSGDTLDVSLQFGHGATSSHPVTRDAGNLARPSLLRSIWSIDSTVHGRPMSPRVLCTDCHNNDNSREFGGTGPNGPHGSKNDHILERRYVMSRVAAGALPGTLIVSLNPNPILDSSPASPYALCAKCHDLNYINSGASWAGHGRHIQKGFSCSVCHSAHGVPAGTSGVTGRALVSFDMNVVASNNGLPVSYTGSGCTLLCHDKSHQ